MNRRSLLGSLALHLCLLPTLALLLRTEPLPLPPEPIIKVTLVPDRPKPAARAPAPPPSAHPAAMPKPDEPFTEVPGNLIEPKTLLAEAVLDDPRSAKAKRALTQVAPEEREIQLCNIEAIQQLHAWKPDLVPQGVVAYAISDPVLTAHTVQADGAAFYDTGTWKGLRYKCSVSADYSKVLSFAFAMGQEIPRSKWDEYELPPEIDDDDGD